MSEMIRPELPPCPECGRAVDELGGFGERSYAMPCGHRVTVIAGAGGVSGSIILQQPKTPATRPSPTG